MNFWKKLNMIYVCFVFRVETNVTLNIIFSKSGQ